jgi:hypothetical protein
MARRLRDAVPELVPAGKTLPQATHSILDTFDAPPTPKHIQPFRKSFICVPGRSHVHYGIARDPPPPAGMRFGRRNVGNVHVQDCLTDPCAIGVAAVANEQAERVYASHKREPLGHTPSLYPIPESKLGGTFGHVSTVGESAKDVIYGGSPAGSEPAASADVEAAAGGSAPVGKAKSRSYDWASVGIDPTRHRFGRNTICHEVVKTVVAEPTRLTPLSTALRGTRQPLDMSKFDVVKRPASSTFALTDVADSDEATLGKTVCKSAKLRALRAADAPADPSRVFGVPTIRVDLSKPKAKKVTSNNNYGDDVPAGGLVNPSLYTTKGVQGEAMATDLTAEAAVRMLERIGVEPAAHAKVLATATKSASGLTYGSFREALETHGF